MVSGDTSHPTSTRPRSWWWISGDKAENTHPSHLQTHVERVNSFKFLGVHITEDLTRSAHTDEWMNDALICSAEEGTSVPILPETAEEVWNEPQHPQIILHLHCGEHPDRLHHRLVWKQHRWQPQSSTKGRVNCPPHCWRWASLPPGHLHQAVY